MKEILYKKEQNTKKRGNMITEILNAASFIIGTALSAFGIWQTYKGNKMQKASKTIDWTQVTLASKALSKLIPKKMNPDVIICPGQKGGIFAQLLAEELGIEVPIYTGFTIDRDTTLDQDLINDYVALHTSKWNVFLPKSIESLQGKNVLIVDDYVMSGDFLQQIKEHLVSNGLANTEILSCSIATTTVAISTRKAPDFYWKIADADACYFPWGKAR